MAAEGWYILDSHGEIYAVKGVVQPPDRFYAIPKRVRGPEGYVKLPTLGSALDYLRRERPHYLFDDPYTGRVQPAVPHNHISGLLRPSQTLSDNVPEGLRRDALDLLEVLGSGEDLGFTGSLLYGLARPDSDIDLVAYGLDFGRRLYGRLARLRAEGVTASVGLSSLPSLLAGRRDSLQALQMAILHEGRKVLTGLFRGRLFMVKLVPWPHEYPESWSRTRCRPLGRAASRFRVLDAGMGIYTPSQYIVEPVESCPHPVSIVVSFRSRFAEHCREGEVIEVVGTLEEVSDGGRSFLRVVVGWEPEDTIVRIG
ncbi:hypothetical protein HRbin01_00866 [archaeon HR01]|nr:hypothetical protein HRbin01_00866 [archaeon HR01]